MRYTVKYYYAIDGDDIGKSLEKYALLNDINSIKSLSLDIKSHLSQIKKYLEENKAVIIFCGGDSLLATSEEEIKIDMNKLIFKEYTFSAGIGSSCCNATLALKKAKGLGKKRVEVIL